MFKKIFSILIAVILCFTMLSGCGTVNNVSNSDIIEAFPKEINVISSYTLTTTDNGEKNVIDYTYTYSDKAEYVNGVVMIDAVLTQGNENSKKTKFAYTTDGIALSRREYGDEIADYSYCMEPRTIQSWKNEDGFVKIEKLLETKEEQTYKLYFENDEYTICTEKDGIVTSYKSYSAEDLILIEVESNKYNIDTVLRMNTDDDAEFEYVFEYIVESKKFELFNEE